ncbi:MAG: F0F1 ATP synthase subunit B [Clostridia bacterium]|nr:F0F1 ATP synthase subunit B [Clostridia bacterium]MBO4429090.1 F0F1 ATP synthase subunit B [Clostridia bacterium]
MGTQSLDIISINLWSILISLANLLIIFLLLKKFLFKPVKKTFAVRSAQVDKIYDDANAAKAEAEANKTLYEQKLAGAKDEAEEILSTARERADRMSDEIVGQANAKAAAKVKRAEEEIAQEKKKAMSEIKNEISTISVDIAEKLIGREIDERDHDELIDKFIKEVGNGDE